METWISVLELPYESDGEFIYRITPRTELQYCPKGRWCRALQEFTFSDGSKQDVRKIKLYTEFLKN